MKRFECLILVFFLCSTAGSPALAQPAHSPWQQLQETAEKVTGILIRLTDTSRNDARKQMHLLCDAVYERFSLAQTARLSLADHWENRSDKEKTEFIALFGRFLESAYLSKASRYDGEQVVFIREQVQTNRAQVHVRVHHGMLRIPITVRMHLTGGGQWMVYDVAVFGVSLVGNLRAQFNHIIHHQSYEQVIRIMKEKTDGRTTCAELF
jgi:phospholipid transport system substrate-binding protein